MKLFANNEIQMYRIGAAEAGISAEEQKRDIKYEVIQRKGYPGKTLRFPRIVESVDHRCFLYLHIFNRKLYREITPQGILHSQNPYIVDMLDQLERRSRENNQTKSARRCCTCGSLVKSFSGYRGV